MFYSCLQFLFVHEVFCLRFSAYEMQLDWIRVRWLTWILNNIPLLCYKKTLVAFKVCTRSYNIAPCTSQFALLLFSTVISSVNTRGTGSTGSRHTHAVIWGDMLVIMSSSCPSPYSSLDIILVQVGLFFIYPQDSVQELYGMFLPKWNLVNGLHLKETLDSRLLIDDLDTNTPTSYCEGVFLHQRKNSSIIHHKCFKNVPKSRFGHA